MINEIYGHRGARGLYPENTLYGFKKCLDNNLSGFELDVVVSKDRQLIVSHEPWMNYKYCSHPKGIPITENNQKTFNLFHLTKDQIQKFDCGSKFNPDFPHQTLKPCKKPTLKEVFKQFNQSKIENISIQIELKSFKEWYGIFQPHPEEYTELVFNLCNKIKLNNKLNQQLLIKSFDDKLLNLLYKKNPNISMGFLIDNNKSIKNNLDLLSFKPKYYNLEQSKITKKIVDELKERHIKITPWTVNTIKDASRLEKMGVNALITDYPNLFTEKYKTI
jgi:glycerophosphoryl diester phosphodiesterase